MNESYQITPEEASSIYAKKFRYLGLPVLLLSFVTSTIYVFINLGMTTQIIITLVGTLIFASLVMYGAYFLGKKFLAPKTMTMKYELTAEKITQIFPNGHKVNASFKKVKKIDEGVFGTVFKTSTFKGVNILNNWSGHDEILEYVKSKLN